MYPFQCLVMLIYFFRPDDPTREIDVFLYLILYPITMGAHHAKTMGESGDEQHHAKT